ncbi:MAG: peptide chain release factor N(5)-glutamine methyltransferase, partial [Halieaceae bacterium]
MATVQQLLQEAKTLPGDSGRRDAEILLCHTLDKPRSYLYSWPESEPSPRQQSIFLELLAQRRDGQPVAYLIGEREFWSLSLTVDGHTLIPRPETETLVSWALELALPDHADVLDLGTGSGAIALALASERPDWQVTAADRSEGAVEIAAGNASRLALGNVHCLLSDWFGAVAGFQFDLLVSNPPYIEEDDPHLQRGDLRFEPVSALAAGPDGLGDLRVLAGQAPAHLNPGGWLLLEHGYQQGDAVRELLREAGFGAVTTRNDLSGHPRITGGCL